MKTLRRTRTALFVMAAVLIASCGNAFFSDNPSDASPASSAQASGTGTLQVYLPAVSPYIMDIFASGKDPKDIDSRALMFASRAELELRDSTGILVDQWTVIAMTYANGSVGAAAARTIPAGTRYSLSAKVYNDKVSMTDAMLTGTVMDITISAGAATSVSIPCIPRDGLAGDLPEGTTTGSLLPGMFDGTNFSTIGAEAWYRIVPGADKNRVTLSLSSGATLAYAAIYRADGTWMNQSVAPSLGETRSSSVPVLPQETYYVGVSLFDASTSPVAYSLNLAESATGASLVANGDFSSGTGGWNLQVPQPATAAIEAVNVRQSTTNKELKVTVSGATPFTGIVLDRRDINIESGKTYTIGYRARVSSGNINIAVALGYYDGSNLVPYGYASGGAMAQYNRYNEASVTVSGPSSASAVICLAISSSDSTDAEFYIDDIYLVDMAPSGPANPIECAGTWSNSTMKVGGATWEISSALFTEKNPQGTTNAVGTVVDFDNAERFMVLQWTLHHLPGATGKYQKVRWIGSPMTALATSNIWHGSLPEALADMSTSSTIPVYAGPLVPCEKVSGTLSGIPLSDGSYTFTLLAIPTPAVSVTGEAPGVATVRLNVAGGAAAILDQAIPGVFTEGVEYVFGIWNDTDGDAILDDGAAACSAASAGFYSVGYFESCDWREWSLGDWGRPRNLTASRNDSSNNLSWVSAAVGDAVADYEIEVSTDTGGTWTPVLDTYTYGEAAAFYSADERDGVTIAVCLYRVRYNDGTVQSAWSEVATINYP